MSTIYHDRLKSKYRTRRKYFFYERLYTFLHLARSLSPCQCRRTHCMSVCVSVALLPTHPSVWDTGGRRRFRFCQVGPENTLGLCPRLDGWKNVTVTSEYSQTKRQYGHDVDIGMDENRSVLLLWLPLFNSFLSIYFKVAKKANTNERRKTMSFEPR